VVSNYDFKFSRIDTNGLLDIIDDLFNAHKSSIENRFKILETKYKILHDIGIIKEKIFKEGL